MTDFTDTIISCYYKVLLVDTETRKFEVIKVPEEEQDYVKHQDDIDLYLAWFSENLLHPEEKKEFEKFTLTVGNNIVYRRKSKENYVHSMMEVRAYEDKIALFVRDIEDIYAEQYIKIAEQVGRHDEFSGALTKKAFEADTKNLERQNLGVIFCDINGLKFINDNVSHAEGDKLIKEVANLLKSAFPDYYVYRIGGDEFVVIAYEANLRSFMSRVVAWHRWLWMNNEHPIASVGYTQDIKTNSVHSLILEAEKAMYVDKQIFYERYPKFNCRINNNQTKEARK